MRSRPLPWLVVLAFCFLAGRVEAASGCVWKVTSPAGGTLYLGGSVHALRSIDYPLPPAYNRAFDASSRIVLEVAPKALSSSGTAITRAGTYPRGDSLKNHVDPRTYDYLRRVFALLKVPEQKFSRYRPWFLVLMLESPSLRGLSGELGVDEFITQRAKTNGKPTFGLETAAEHYAVFSGLTDRQSEALLLVTFIPQAKPRGNDYIMSAWRRGDVESLARSTAEAYQEFPAFGYRILGARNRRWAPKIEGYLKSGQTYFVLVGAAHLGGSDGLLALLRARGYKVEQI
jgi:uncharacterized protein